MPEAATAAPRRKSGTVRTATVLTTTRLTPEMIRVELTGADLAALPVGDHTDAYVKLVFPPADAPYHDAAEFAAMRDDLAPAHKPMLRTYTIRRYDQAAGQMTLDFVYHGDEGVAGPWAANAQPGDTIMFLGPGGGYAPEAAAAWHLLIGDESALPAIAAAAERVPAGVPVIVYAEIARAEEEQQLSSPGDLDVHWVHRDGAGGRRGPALVEAVRAAELPAGDGQAFLHGEAGMVKELRHHLRFERGIPRERFSVSGYWRLGRDDEGWRSEKRAWSADVEADEQANAG